jgi:diaminohydroxyphosphoribosylaminopyrimidine deaminase/5-amino-6-(5-phosphoribosylamino)uracil reductase
VADISTSRQTDEAIVHQALDLACEGIGLTSPNPCVGAILVDNKGETVGSGSYTYDGVKHAEVIALEQAGGRARGATLYINLEPCSHHGRTGPCVDALIAAGVRRVVACMSDPNPLVTGAGFPVSATQEFRSHQAFWRKKLEL